MKIQADTINGVVCVSSFAERADIFANFEDFFALLPQMGEGEVWGVEATEEEANRIREEFGLK